MLVKKTAVKVVFTWHLVLPTAHQYNGVHKYSLIKQSQIIMTRLLGSVDILVHPATW